MEARVEALDVRKERRRGRGRKAVKGCTGIDRIKGEINEIRGGKETRRMRRSDEGFFIYKLDDR